MDDQYKQESIHVRLGFHSMCVAKLYDQQSTQLMRFQKTKQEEGPWLLFNNRNGISNLHSTSKASQLFYEPRNL